MRNGCAPARDAEHALHNFPAPRARFPPWARVGTALAYMMRNMKTHHAAPILSILLTVASAAWAGPGDTDGLRLNFQDAPLRAVLDYLSDRAGLIVVSEADVRGAVTVTARQPVSLAEAVSLLNDQLSRNHYTALFEGRTLTIMEASRARTNALTPVVTASDPAKIPVDNEIVTEILPVHILNPAQLVKDLEPLIPGGDTVTANDAGNALIMTACQKDIHRLASIIAALDSTAVSEINVFALNFADAKSVAAELKELFQSADADVSRAGARMTMAPRFGRISTDGGGEPKEKTATTRAVFVADEQMNAVAASAPPDYMPMIARVVGLLDRPGQEVTDIEVFPLLHADADEVVEEISSLFAPASGAGNAEPLARPMGFQFGGPGMSPSASRTATESNRLKRQTTVTAVADRRTQAVLVAAAGNAMAQIRKVVAKLDEGQKGVAKFSVYAIGCADPGIVQEAMTTLFASTSLAGHTPAQITTPLGAREQAEANSQSTPSATSGPLGTSAGAGVQH
jgi:type II secretory pathway component GspD/PulD (secretin)